MAEQLTTVAEFRKDALQHVDPVKTQISAAMRSNTPVICLACVSSNNFGTDCTDGGDMHGAVDEAWQWGSTPETPLIEICSKFVSLRAIHKAK